MLTTISDLSTQLNSYQLQNKSGRSVKQFAPIYRNAKQVESNLTIMNAATTNQLRDVKDLMISFVEWLRNRYKDQLWFVDGYFNRQAFQAELDSLPGDYSKPTGRLLLAKYQHEPAGCVAIKSLDKKTCEMKRMYVSPYFQGKRIGRALAETIIHHAKSIGYRRMLLDTGCKQIEAQSLYRRLGFVVIKPYYEVSEEERNMLTFMELMLK